MSAMSTALSPQVPTGPSAADLLRTGREHYKRGELKDAIAIFRAGLALAATMSIGTAADIAADLHAALANAFMLCDDLDSAADNYRAALRLAPHLVACWCNLGNVHLKTGMAQQAIALYLEALRLSPAHRPSRTNLVQALVATRQYVLAQVLLGELIEETPEDAGLHAELGKVCFELKQIEDAIAHFERAAALAPERADNLYWIGAIRQAIGESEASEAAYERAVRLHPVLRRPATRSPASFRVLALFAPFVGNTPVAYLFRDCAYQTDILSLSPSIRPDLATLACEVDVVVNLVCDADQGAAVLPLADEIARHIGKPVVNEPEKALRTTRDATAAVLAGIPACRVPRTLRIAAGHVLPPAGNDLTFPLLARPAGTHGGEFFARFEDPDALTAFLAERVSEDRYLIEPIDYRSADGFFRKYRFIFVGEEILPYHLAIGDGWKLHRDSTDMASQDWMQREEEQFLRAPKSVFSAGHYDVLQMVRSRIGLDYFGIDCALDGRGYLVVFEVNASMLVHDENPDFPYKDPFVRRIKTAFDAMLRRLARTD
ncbi:tetratricopeptide repeat protein [Bradyrhizobium sp. CCGUVB1N3]|uniref:tetratricopeptide repeat protein n=1 Tax=Bradyrhizobium sp. CCGUVB1N3 TaxID=2949629 RepID=UPI0020B26B35|nr:tetratricopeptide repeat protein [Bradyrhizobium sp. CCGUVB1N3]MCP3471159.1 tetratricopeptide repeat protein [Bradyrhizobium sp. CCGUVB1N3]